MLINSLTIKNVNSYNSTGVLINDLKKVNFCFGNNGSGKSTIAKYLYDLSIGNTSTSNFSQCLQSGYNNSDHQILVFNEDFIVRNFISKNTQSGIFSLNEKNDVIDQQITSEQNVLKKLQSYILHLEKRKIYIRKKKNDQFETLKEECFEKRKSTIQSFLKIKDTFPYKQKQNNYDYLVTVIQAHNPIPDVTFEALTNNYKKYYDTNLTRIEHKLSVDIYKSILEIEHNLDLLLQKVIIGNDDVDIAKMINELQIKKWVEDGITYLDHSKPLQHCPFCQQETIDSTLLEKFKLYFDESYKNDIAAIETLRANYTNAYNSFLLNVQSLVDVFNDENIVSNFHLEIKRIFEENIKIIEEKLKKSNEKKSIFSIRNIKETIENIDALI